jgi:hypothetical protein
MRNKAERTSSLEKPMRKSNSKFHSMYMYEYTSYGIYDREWRGHVWTCVLEYLYSIYSMTHAPVRMACMCINTKIDLIFI